MSLCSCCHSFVPPWPCTCGFSVFIPKAYQEVLKRLIHGDMLLFLEVKEGMAELDLNAQGSGVMFHDWYRQKAFLLGLYRDRIKHMLRNTFPMFLSNLGSRARRDPGSSWPLEWKEKRCRDSQQSLPGKGSPAVSRKCVCSKMLLMCASPLRNLVLCCLLWIHIVRNIPCKHAWLIRTLS